MRQDELDIIVARVRRQGTDDGTVEVKASAERLSKDIWDSVSAFANTRGGAIILGLREDEGFAPAQGFSFDAVRDALVDGLGDGNVSGLKITDPPRYSMSRLDVDGSPVLVVDIVENEVGAKPCFVTAKGLTAGSFKRVDDKNVRLSPTEIFELKHQLRLSAHERDVVSDATVEDLRPDLVAALAASPRSAKAVAGLTTQSARLRSLNVLNRDGDVTFAALLVLGRYPQRFFPRLFVDVAVHPTAEKSSASEQLRFVDRMQCDGPLADLVEEALSALRRNLRTHSVVEGAGRVDVLEIPEEVLREAIANAVVHREYEPQFHGQPVAVDLYPDRVEVTSPGGLWGGTTVENIAEGVSRCRNQVLLQLLERVPLTSGVGTVVEGNGSGVPLMNHLMTARALERPDFGASTPDRVRVVLRRHGVEVPEMRRWLTETMPRPLSLAEETVVLLAQREGRVDLRAIGAALGRDSEEVRPVLARLVADGVLQAGGGGEYLLRAEPRVPRGVDLIVLDALSTTAPMSIQELADGTDRTPNALRPVLRRLVASGRVVATAPPTSRHRRYLRATSG